MQEINLLQSKLKDKTNNWETNNRIVVILLTLVLIAEFVAAGMFYYMKDQNEKENIALAQENVAIQKKINSQNEKLANATGFQAQTKNIQVLLNNHVVWNKLMDEISKSALKNSRYMSMSAETDGIIHLEGITKNYIELGKTLLALQTSTIYKSARLISTAPSGTDEAGVIYSIDLEVDPTVFTYQ